MNILKKVNKYFYNECEDFMRFIKIETFDPTTPTKDDEIRLIEMYCKATLDRGIGVIMFVQDLGISYDDIIESYENFRKAINKLADYAKRVIK